MHLRLLTAAVLVLTGAAPPLLADDPALVPVTLLIEGDPLLSPSVVTSINSQNVGDAGHWIVRADTDFANTDADEAVLNTNVLELVEGQPLALPAGTTLGSFGRFSVNGNGDYFVNLFLDGTSGLSDDSGVYFDGSLVFQESFVSTAAGFSPGTIYTGFFGGVLNDSNQVLLMASVDDPAILSTTDRALVLLQLSPSGALVSETVLVKEGDAAPGTTEFITDFETGQANFDFTNSGNVMFVADLTGPTAQNAAVYWNGGILAREGDPSPIAARNWLSLSGAEVATNDDGDTVFSGSLDGDSATNLILVKNGQKFVQEGDSLPGMSGFGLTSFGSGPIEMSEDGDVLWFGDWADPDTTKDTGLFLNDLLIVQEGVSQIGGTTVKTVRGITGGYEMSRNGRYIVFEAELIDGREGAFVIDRGPWTDLDRGLAGATGVPRLIGHGTLQPGSPVSMRISGALPSALSGLVIGASTVNAPFMGTTLVPFPNIVINGIPLGANGSLLVPSTWPVGLPPGSNFFFQWLVFDPAATFGLASSNAVQAITP